MWPSSLSSAHGHQQRSSGVGWVGAWVNSGMGGSELHLKGDGKVCAGRNQRLAGYQAHYQPSLVSASPLVTKCRKHPGTVGSGIEVRILAVK